MWHDGEPLSTGSPQQRALLAALLLREGRTATAGELIDALWGDEPPSQALAAVRTYASRLRKALSPGVLVSESGGYAIRLSEAHSVLDLSTARELAAEAEKAKATGDLRHARALLNRALSLWDGEPLTGVPGPYAEKQRIRLEEWRLQLLESRLDMDLEQGNHSEAVSELTALTAAHPLRERLRELLMLALYRCGRQAEALAVYADIRRLLADELGVDPRPGLSALQQRILEADPGLVEPSAPVAEPAAVPVLPRQLPATVPDFTGRASFVKDLTDVLSSASGAEGSVMAVSAIGGIAGVGKTALAVHVAQLAQGAYPDGQLYVNLQRVGARPADPETVLGAFLRALGTVGAAIPDSLEERAALYRSLLHGRRVLVLLDNARDAAQVRPLLPGTAGCAALVTSRARMVDLAGAHLVDLDVMSPAEALELFTKIAGEERVAAEREAALDVVAACGFLPLAIRIVASRLVARRTWTVSVLAAKLDDERRRLDELRAGDMVVKAALDVTYGQLKPAQARAFRLLGLAPGPDISLEAASAVIDSPVDEAEDLLESLVDMSLLEEAEPGRYRFHELVRLYARACAERDAPASERESALVRLLDFYLSTAARVYTMERPGNHLVDHLESSSREGLSFDTRRQAQDWLFVEGRSLLATARQAATAGLRRKAVDLLLTVQDLAESGSDFARYQSAATAVRDAAEAAGDARAEVRARAIIARVHCLAGRFRQADAEACEALRLSPSVHDPWAIGYVLHTRGVIALHDGRHTDGEAHLRQAIANFHANEDESAVAGALCVLSRVHLATGRTQNAVELAQQGMEIYDRLGHTLAGAHARYALGLALAGSGSPYDAMPLLEEALETFRGGRQRLWEGMTLLRIAEIHLARSAPAEAAHKAELSLSVMGGIGGDKRRADTLTLLGRALSALDLSDRATACWRDALSLYEDLGSPEAETVRTLLSRRYAA
ncbi:transcriptional regulator AfsR [Streptomyces phyllanthi]